MADMKQVQLTVGSVEEMQNKVQLYLGQGYTIVSQYEKSVSLKFEEKMDYLVVGVLIFLCVVPGIIYYLIKKDKLRNELVTITIK